MWTLFKIVLFGGLFLLVMIVLGFAGLFLYGWMENRHYEKLTDTHDLPRRIDEMAAPYVNKRQHVTLTIGLTQRGKRFFKEFKADAIEKETQPEGKPIYEIGSITKVFTGILLARLESEGLVTLDETIDSILPKEANVSGPAAKLTLKQLATHTAALPRLPSNLDVNSNDPYATYGAQQIYADLHKVKLNGEPGKSSDYSNYGMGLLGHLLSLKADKKYEDLIQEKICVPLSMVSTTGKLNEQQTKRFIQGYDPEGKETNAWSFDVLEAAGSLRSDVEDMLTFIEKNLHPPADEVGKSLRRAQEVHFSNWLGSLGLGWQISDDPYINKRIHWHNGGTAGFISYLGLVASDDVGVVILSNYGDAFAGDSSVDEMGIRLLRYATKISLE